MAKKLTAVHADGTVLTLTPNQFTQYKMKERPAQLICRVGHFSVGVYGIRYPRGARTYIGTATDLVAMREYTDLGESLEQLNALETSDLAEKDAHWGLNWAKSKLTYALPEMARILDDLGGSHPLDAELRAELEALRAVYVAFIDKLDPPTRFTVVVTAIGERATTLKEDGEETRECFTGSQEECCAWVAKMHGDLAGRRRKPAATLAAAQAAWSRTGFADEWELTFNRA